VFVFSSAKPKFASAQFEFALLIFNQGCDDVRSWLIATGLLTVARIFVLGSSR
jgi:hypothetical protein